MNSHYDNKKTTFLEIYEKQIFSTKGSEKYILQESINEPKFKVNLDNPLKNFPLQKPNIDIDPQALNTFSGPISYNCSVQPSYRNFDKFSKGIDLEHVMKIEPTIKQIIVEESPEKSTIVQSNLKRSNVKELSNSNISYKFTKLLNSSKIQLNVNPSVSKGLQVNHGINNSISFDRRRDKKNEPLKIPLHNLDKQEFFGKIKKDLVKLVKSNYHQYVNTSANNCRNSNNSSSNSKYLYTCETSSNKTLTKHLNTSKELKNCISGSKKLRNKKS